MPDIYISRVKLSDGSTYAIIKDAEARSDISTLLGTHALAAIGAAGWLGVDNAVTTDGQGVVTGGKIKEYVDAQVGSINKFDIVVCEANAAKIPAGAIYRDGSTVIVGTMPAGPQQDPEHTTTMYKIYLVKDDSIQDGAYSEWITIRSGTEGSYTYTWEKIGSTAADFDDYVKKTTKIAGIDLQDDITVSELQGTLKLAGFAYADTGSGTVSTIDSITMDPITVSGDISISSTSVTATLTKTDYQPSGSVAGEVSTPTINLTKSTVTYATGLNKGSAVVAALEGVVVSVGTATAPPSSTTDPWNDYETLIFTTASTHNVMDYTVTASTATFDNVTNATATKPSWSGSFTGNTAEDIIVTGVTYDKASGNAQFAQTITPTVATYTRTSKVVTVTPNVTATTTVTPPANN